jgi:Domain of unknown function (DUF932)
MKQGQSLPELAQELQRQALAARDFKLPTRLLTYQDNQTVTFKVKETSETFTTTPLFVEQLATKWAGIPKKYVDKMVGEAPALLSQNVNHWLQQDDEPRLVRTLDGRARAFLSPRYRVLDNSGVVAAILPTFQRHSITTMSAAVTESRLWLKGVNEKKTVEVRKGDAVQFGVAISNSEVGLGAVRVDPLIYRLICTNGAIVPDSGMRKFHIGRRLDELDESHEVFRDETRAADDKAFFLKLRDVVEAAFDDVAMTDVLQAVQAGTTRRIGTGKKLETVVEVVGKSYGFNDAETEGVLRSLIDGGDLTQYGLANAVTQYSQQSERYERATELEKAGGTLMTMTEAEWKEVN